ncbi:MAG: hypothetical protein ACYDAG_05710 [Chloroflexota bacterium]
MAGGEDTPEQMREDITEHVAGPDRPERETARETRPGTRSGLTRWVAERQSREVRRLGGPSYERCTMRECWGKASWICPGCGAKLCSPHRPDHSCSLPYLPR